MGQIDNYVVSQSSASCLSCALFCGECYSLQGSGNSWNDAGAQCFVYPAPSTSIFLPAILSTHYLFSPVNSVQDNVLLSEESPDIDNICPVAAGL